MWVQSLGREDSLEKEMTTHSSILAWRIPWTEMPGRVRSIGLHRIGYNWSDSACMHMCPYYTQSSRNIMNYIKISCFHNSMLWTSSLKTPYHSISKSAICWLPDYIKCIINRFGSIYLEKDKLIPKINWLKMYKG